MIFAMDFQNRHSPLLGRKRCYSHVLLLRAGTKRGEVPDPLGQRGTFGVHGDHCKTSEVIDCDGVRYDKATSSFSDSRYGTICCNLDICYLLFYPSILSKKKERKCKGEG